MRIYFYRIWLALRGRNPYRPELIEAKRNYKKERAHARDLQQLTENLRKRITDKDIEIEDQEVEIRGLREDLELTLQRLQDVQKAQAHELISKQLLQKTNLHLGELVEAMKSGDTEKLEMYVEGEYWNKHMAAIARLHLSALKAVKASEQK